MDGSNWVLRLVLVVPIVALLSGCAGQGTTRSGFLSSYDGMAPTAEHTDDLIYVDPEYVPGKYHQVIIDPVEWQPAPGAPPRDPLVIEQLKTDFHKSLTDALSKHYAETVRPALGASAPPGVLRVRSAITNTRKAHWWINGAAQVAGLGLTVVGLPGPPQPDPGGASEEIEVDDARSGKRLVAIATYNNGMPWQTLGFYNAFRHARQSFEKAAQLLVDQIHPTPSQ